MAEVNCPTCVVGPKKRPVPLTIIERNFHGCGVDMFCCRKCSKGYCVSYKIDQITHEPAWGCESMINEGTKVVYAPKYFDEARTKDKVIGHVVQQTTDGFYRVKWIDPPNDQGDFFTLGTVFKAEELLTLSRFETLMKVNAQVKVAGDLLQKAEETLRDVDQTSLHFRLHTQMTAISRLSKDLDSMIQIIQRLL